MPADNVLNWNPWVWRNGTLVRAGKGVWRQPVAKTTRCPTCKGSGKAPGDHNAGCCICNSIGAVQPYPKWPPGSRVRVCPASDFCDPGADDWRAKAWKILGGRPDLNVEIATNMPERLGECLPWGRFTHCCDRDAKYRDPDSGEFVTLRQTKCPGCTKPGSSEFDVWPNVILTTRAQSQAELAERWPLLVAVPAAKYGVRLELRGAVDLSEACECPECGGAIDIRRFSGGGLDSEDPCPNCRQNGDDFEPTGIDPRLAQVTVCGGSEPMHPDWVRAIRDQCAGAGIGFEEERG